MNQYLAFSRVHVCSNSESEGMADLKSASMATRMSWRPERDTINEMDMAYYLLASLTRPWTCTVGKKRVPFPPPKSGLQTDLNESVFAETYNKLQSSGLLAP